MSRPITWLIGLIVAEYAGHESSYYLADWLIVKELTGQDSSWRIGLIVAELTGQESSYYLADWFYSGRVC